jgi:hypothetical protein
MFFAEVESPPKNPKFKIIRSRNYVGSQGCNFGAFRHCLWVNNSYFACPQGIFGSTNSFGDFQ